MSTTVPKWQIAIPVVTVVVLGYTIFRNVIPYPTGAGFWLPIVAGIGSRSPWPRSRSCPAWSGASARTSWPTRG